MNQYEYHFHGIAYKEVTHHVDSPPKIVAIQWFLNLPDFDHSYSNCQMWY